MLGNDGGGLAVLITPCPGESPVGAGGQGPQGTPPGTCCQFCPLKAQLNGVLLLNVWSFQMKS